ncbi:hypothetical protein HHI36_010888 [Cryptolaemus montrouzieri]|uniref:Bifunctional lysine-specific demethylase and histidyl-hydroxylase n=1 Tax=Cryptolaemus montrouzieri TaxID=559131 RepID=A0ABD2MKE0_9CUCU
MKVPQPVSAFTMYKNAYTKMNASEIQTNRKKKLKAKARSDKKITNKQNKSSGKGLNSTKVFLGMKNGNIELIDKLGKLDNAEVNRVRSPKKKTEYKVRPKRQKKRASAKKIGGFTLGLSMNNEEKSNNLSRQMAGRVNSRSSNSGGGNGDSSIFGTDPIMKGYHLFEWMISPMNPKNFFDNHWELEVLHVPRKNKKYYSHLLTSRNLDQIFRENSLYYTRNVDVVIYENGEKQVLNPEGKANPSALWDFYSNGCSVRILNPQTYNKKVHLLVSTLQEYFGSMVGVNVYLTPPGSQGFAPHFDDIEAFVIQVEGRKHWKLYHPKEEDILTRHSSKNFTHEEIGDPFLEVSLEAGSLLYFPRGVIHEGRTDAESHSLHLTVSLYQNNAYVDLLEKVLPDALAKAAKQDINFRKGLPLHFLRKDDAKQIVRNQVSALIEKLKDYLDVDVGIAQLGRRLVYDSMPPVLSAEEIACSSKQDGDLLDDGVVFNKVEFDLSTKVRLTRYHCIQIVNDEEMKPKLYYSTENSNIYHGEEEQWLDLDPCMISAIESLQSSYPAYISIDSLPIEDVEIKVQFVYDLWEKGIVITKEPLGSSSDSNKSLENVSDNSDSE